MEFIISVVCYRSKILKNGESPLMVRVAKNGKRTMKSLGISVHPQYWDFKKNCPKKNCPNRTTILQLISETLLKYQKRTLIIKANGEDVTADAILKRNQLPERKITVEDFLTGHIQQLRDSGKVGNRYAYMNLHATMKNFYGMKLHFPFDEVDVAFCSRFETWMRKQKYEDTTMSFYFRTLRSTYNKAVEAKSASREKNPFLEYKLSRFNTKTQKRALSKENVKKIIGMDCSEITRKTKLAHDIFSFSYYCGGISFIDVANLTHYNIIEGRLIYERQKTHGTINLMLLNEAKAIIEQYTYHQKNAGYLFPILDSRKHITEMQKYNRVRKICRQVNTELHKIAKRLEIEEDVTTYVARHSFATVLKKSGVNIGIISQALGHKDIKTTQIYLSEFDNEQVDSVMQNLL